MAGWNRPGEAPKKAAKKPSPVRGVIAGALVVALAAGAYFAFFAGTGEKPQKAGKEKSPSAIKEVTPAPAPKAAEKPAPKAEEKQKAPNFDTNKWQLVNGFVIPKGARLPRNSLTNKQVSVYKYSTDSLIAGAIQPPSGTIMPPLPPLRDGLDKVFLRSLNDPIEILDSDSPELRAQKEAVIVARAQIKEMMDQGMSFREVLQENRKLMMENAEIRRKAQDELNAIYESGDADGAKKYESVMNLALQQMGVEELDAPTTKEERREARHRKYEERRALRDQRLQKEQEKN